MDSYQGVTALITGASSGIGLGIARALAARGAKVAIGGTNPDKLAAALAGLDAPGKMAVRFDVTDRAGWAAAVAEVEARLGPIAVLGLNAGAGAPHAPIDAVPPDTWAWQWDLNVMGAVNGLGACLPGMKARGAPGRILFTSSIGAFMAMKGAAPYSAAKAALIAIAESLRQELSDTPIGVSVAAPAAVATDLAATSARHLPDGAGEPDFGFVANLLKTHGRDPEEVGAFIVDKMAAGAFYIFTHPENRGLVEARAAEQLAAFD